MSKFSSLDIEDIRKLIDQFTKERDWDKVGEVGELCEIFQWRDDSNEKMTEEEHIHLGEEISDVLIYLLQIAGIDIISHLIQLDRCNVDLSKAVLAKLEKNKKKYPAFGKSEKYTEYGIVDDLSKKASPNPSPIDSTEREKNRNKEFPLKLYLLSIVPLILVVLINLFTGFDILKQIKNLNL